MSIKGKLKKSKYVMSIYNKILPYYCMCFPETAAKMLYKQTFQKKLDLKNPEDFNEKINWLKVKKYNKDPLVIQCADKWRVREYIKAKGYGDILNEIHKTYKSADEIDWDELPEQFVLKFNKAAGMNIICDDKSKLNKQLTLKKVKGWFNSETGERYCELHYRKAKPVIICEKYLKPSKGLLPIDYKVHCLNGEPVVTLICLEREQKLKLVFVDNEYRRVNIDTKNYPNEIIPPKQECFDQIIKISRDLAKPFPLVRIDFYIIDGKPVFGEMTFTPQGGFINYITEEGLIWLGNKLKLQDVNS